MDIEVFVKFALIFIIVLLLFIVITFNVLLNFLIASETKKNKKVKRYEYIDALNKEYEKLIIPSLKRLIVKLGNDIPLNGEEREILKDIITKENLK